jgi:glycyl-tRNA synthetase beta chain
MKAERRDFLLEIGTEELPPKALPALQQALVAGLAAGLDKAGLAHGELVGFATPRRLAVWVKRLAAQQPEQHLKRRGPPVNAAFDAAGRPTRAALAFAESCGTRVEALQRLDEGKGTFLFFLGTRAGERAVALLPGLVQAALDALPIPRRMHWGAGNAMFVRPVHWVVMLYGKEVVAATLLDTPAGHLTRGHRFHAPRPIRIASPGSYERTLRERGYVLADFAARRERIRAQVTAAAVNVQGRALISEALLQEVTALVEWPVALTGRFEERFLSLPREVLTSTLEDHQRYFPVEDAQGRLLPAFIAVSNIESRDPATVRAGNERVVRPRLADAAFFWEQDRRQPLAARRAEINAVTSPVRSPWRPVAHASTPSAQRNCASAICSPPWWASFPSCRASWVRTTRRRTVSRTRWPRRFASTTCRARPAISCPPRARAWRSPSRTSSTPSPASSRSARNPREPRIRSGCGVRRWACSAS